MEKNIQKLLKQLKMEILIALFLMILVVVLGQLGIIENGIVEPKSQTEYVLNIIVVILTVVGIPGSLKIFSLNTTKTLRRMNLDEALQSYHIWSAARLLVLFLSAVVGALVYYFATSTSSIVCSLACVSMIAYCWPSRSKIDTYLNGLNNEVK
ncbi:MAG: hypothetical protein KBT29_10130 [Prevotellaceae bacterium]|nr:hypothetical protein [Candidatus Minthosoma caballi]